MPKKYRTILGVAAIVIFAALGLWSMKETATPYVDFDEARSLKKNVQVFGRVEHRSSNYDENSGVFTFYIVDEEGDKMKVDYIGTKPGNFEQAESVVCVGRYENDAFVADHLLVKCPSKYQGTEIGDEGV